MRVERLFWIDLHYACVGIVSENNRIVLAPPIVGWMKGKLLADIKPFLIRKKAVVVEIKPNTTTPL